MYKKQGLFVMIAFFLSIVFISVIYSFSLSNVSLSPSNATTTDDLICTWTLSGSATVNVTWYNGTVNISTIVNASNPQILSSGNTAKDQTWNCTVTAANSTTITRLSSKVTIKNALPSKPNVNNQTMIEDVSFNGTANSTDADGDTVTYEYVSNNLSLTSFNTNTGAWTWTPNASSVGLNYVIFRATDDGGITLVGKQVIFNVTAVNDRPFFTTSISNQSVTENNTFQYSVTIDDEENSSGPFSFFINSSFNPEQLEANTSNNKTFTIQFLNNRVTNFSDRGNHSVFIEACDPDNSSLCINSTFNLEVIPINQPPQIILIPNASGIQNQNFTLYINATDADISDTLSFSVSTIDCTLSNPWSIQTINNSNNATGLINVSTLNNTHIACKNITITVTDTNYITSQNVYLNLTNVNDPPVLYNESYSVSNTNSNVDIRNLTSFVNVTFNYQINGTDPDLFSDDNESLTYMDNSSLCGGNCPVLTTNSSTGLLTFLPNSSFIGIYIYRINLSDNYGQTVATTLNITILNNSPPIFVPSLTNLTSNESLLFTYQVNATDQENHTVTFTDNSTVFNISSSGLINFTPACAQVGNYSTQVIATDQVGAISRDNFNFEIVNNPDAPVLPSVDNETILENLLFVLNIGGSTTDDDITCGQPENLTFTSDFIAGIEIFNISSNGIINFTPDSTHNGGYLVNISVTDLYGLTSNLIWNLTVVNRTDPPQIVNVSPYGFPTVFSFINVTDLSGNITTINITEGNSVFYDQNSIDPDGDEIFYNWTENGVVVSSAQNYSRTFNFSDAGVFNITLTISDNVSGILGHEVRFTWNTSVENFNRAPLINDSLPNITVNSSITIGNYLTGIGFGETRFNDPDGDNLTYTHSNVSIVTISFNGDDISLTAVSIGNATVVFTATDPSGDNVSSNNVTIVVNQLPPSSGPSSSSSSSSGSSGSSSNSQVQVPITVTEQVEKDKEVFLDIIVPEPVTIYRNNTLRQVISLVNNGNETLRGIFISALTNNSNTELSFSTDFFPELLPGQTVKTDLTITSFKLLNTYEIFIWANVTEPKFNDKAVIYVNAIEKTRGNQSLASTKITFARDLLSSNPECIELNEFLKEAQSYMDIFDYLTASDILDSVVQGCKYLVSQTKLQDERPTGFNLGIDLDSNPFIKPALILFIIGLIVSVGLTIKARNTKTAEEEN